MNFTRRQTIFKYTNQDSEHTPIVLTDLMPLSLTWSKGIIRQGIIELLPAPPRPHPTGSAQPEPPAPDRLPRTGRLERPTRTRAGVVGLR
jgi:hypothetical protein